MIVDKKMCIYDCSKDTTYKYEYNIFVITMNI